MLNKEWSRYYATFEPSHKDKKVDYIDLELVVNDAVIRNENNQDTPIYFTDVHFQPGTQLSGWVPHTKEMLKQLNHDSDEWQNVPSGSIFEGTPPQLITDMETRAFNIVGRGHSIITIPNYYPEDWDKEILPTGVDFTIYAKEDFDLCRISTYSGVLLEGEECLYNPVLEQYPNDSFIQNTFLTHPLNYRYTREFWFDGGAAGTEIKLHASTRTAELGGVAVPIKGIRNTNIEGTSFYIARNQFMTVPKGAIRYRIEFYKSVAIDAPEKGYDGAMYVKDTGIGFYGTAEFKQWTYGRSHY